MNRRLYILGLVGRCIGIGHANNDAPLERELTKLDDDAWLSLLACANRHLLGPALAHGLRERVPRAIVPDDIAIYLDRLLKLNETRNERIAAQIVDVAHALNVAGIMPCVMKGVAALVTDSRAAAYRMIGDVDLLVPNDQADKALTVLINAGYSELRTYPPDAHTVADIARSNDVAAIDLHRNFLTLPSDVDPNLRTRLLPTSAVLHASAVRTWRGVRLLVPAPEHRVLHLVAHDHLQDRDFYAGRLNLRHLHDCANIVSTMRSEARRRLMRETPDAMRPMLAVQLRAGGWLFDMPWICLGKPSPYAWLAFQHCRLQIIHPRLESLGRWVGVVTWHTSALRGCGVGDVRPRGKLQRLFRPLGRTGALRRAIEAWRVF